MVTEQQIIEQIAREIMDPFSAAAFLLIFTSLPIGLLGISESKVKGRKVVGTILQVLFYLMLIGGSGTLIYATFFYNPKLRLQKLCKEYRVNYCDAVVYLYSKGVHRLRDDYIKCLSVKKESKQD